MRRATQVMMVMIMTIGLCGCESDLLDDLRNKVDDEVNAASADTSGGDAISISSISWLGDNYSSASRTATITGATVGRNVISTSYQPYSWPRTTVKVSVDAICCLFYERGGQIVGGKFDWWRTGGQGSKGLENVHHGYNGHSMPSSGTPTYTMIVSVDGRQRSNIQRCTWR